MPDKVYTLVDYKSGTECHMTLPMILNEINRDRNSQWIDYDETDWREGLEEFTTWEVKDA